MSNGGAANPSKLANDLGKRLLEAARLGHSEEVTNLMKNGAPLTTDWVRILNILASFSCRVSQMRSTGWEDRVGKMAKNCMKMTKSAFWGQISGGTWGRTSQFLG